jgi:hypothetical protein
VTRRREKDSVRKRRAIVEGARAAIGRCTNIICGNAFAKAGICPWDQAKPLGPVYLIDSDMDNEDQDKRSKPHLFHGGSPVMTSDDFLGRLENWQQQREAAKPPQPKQKNLK